MEPEKELNSKDLDFFKARRKLDGIALGQALDEYKKDNTINLRKRKEEIFAELLSQLKKEKNEKDLLAGINKLVENKSDIEARYKDLISEEEYEKLKIRKKADEILKQLKKEQKERQLRKVESSIIDKTAKDTKKQEEAKKIQTIEEARKRAEYIRRAELDKERKFYEDRQRKIANLKKQLAFICEPKIEPVQDRKVDLVQSIPVQKPSVRPSNVKSQNPIPERVVIKEVEPAPKKENKPVQALVPRKQKSSFIERIQNWGIKVADKFSEATMTAYEMLTFKHNRDVAVGKRKERVVSPAEASNAYEKNMINYSNSQSSIDVRSKSENTPTSFKAYLQAKADEKAAQEAMKSKSKNEPTRSSGQRGA